MEVIILLNSHPINGKNFEITLQTTEKCLENIGGYL